jgi:thiol-disulfide isomerase/thioredoxin
MKKAATIVILFAIGCTGSVNQEIFSDHEGENILLGEINWDGLSTSSYAEWFNPNYLNYQVDTESLATISSDFSDVTIVTVIGTWCEDSQTQVPQFYKILDNIKFDITKMKVIGVDRSDDGLVVPEKFADFEITLVPTFIFYRGDKEVGRITEYPVKTLEKDMLEIVGN